MLLTEGLCQTDVVNCLLMVIQHSLQGLHSCMIIPDPTDAVLESKNEFRRCLCTFWPGRWVLIYYVVGNPLWCISKWFRGSLHGGILNELFLKMCTNKLALGWYCMPSGLLWYLDFTLQRLQMSLSLLKCPICFDGPQNCPTCERQTSQGVY